MVKIGAELPKLSQKQDNVHTNTESVQCLCKIE